MENNLKKYDSKLKEYYEKKDYSKIFDMYLMYEKEVCEVRYLIYALFETGNWDEFSRIVDIHNEDLFLWEDSSKIFGYKGLVAFGSGQYDEAKSNLLISAKQNGEYSDFALEWLLTLKLTKFDFVNRQKMNFHFSNELGLEMKKQFIRKYLDAYYRITKYLPNKCNKSIDIYVFLGWVDDIGNRLSYANTALCTIHVNVNDDAGHELTHIISSYNLSIKLKFIEEGMAEYYDDLIRGYTINDDFYELSLYDCCEKFSLLNKDYTYLFARVFISHVFEYYEGNLDAAKPILESCSYEDMLMEVSGCLNCLEKRTKKTIRKLKETNRCGKLTYIGRSDLYTLP